jgi:hypothetical protein
MFERGVSLMKESGEKEHFTISYMKLAVIISIVGILASAYVALNTWATDQRFVGLTERIDALRSDLERIEKISSALEQRADIYAGGVSIINQYLQNVTDRLTKIESLNQSQPIITNHSEPVTLAISYPQSGNRVDWTTSVTGTCTGMITNKTLSLYLLVYPLESEVWFVQNRPTINTDGSWSGLVYFGRNPDMHPEDAGKRFFLKAIVTTVKLQPGETLTESEIPETLTQYLISDLMRK